MTDGTRCPTNGKRHDWCAHSSNSFCTVPIRWNYFIWGISIVTRMMERKCAWEVKDSICRTHNWFDCFFFGTILCRLCFYHLQLEINFVLLKRSYSESSVVCLFKSRRVQLIVHDGQKRKYGMAKMGQLYPFSIDLEWPILLCYLFQTLGLWFWWIPANVPKFL